MVKKDRILALEIAKNNDIKTTLSWWDPFQNIQWKVLKSKQELSHEQYGYLSKNGFLEVKQELKKGEIVILTISQKGIEKLKSLTTI